MAPLRPSPVQRGSSILTEKAVLDLIYLAAGVGVLVLFAGYAVLLRRA
jgi:hypothetical protein